MVEHILDIKLLSNNNQGTFIISNLDDTTKTNWEIKIKLNNFQITSMNRVNYSQDKRDLSIFTITPKEWKINIEGKSQLVSNFEYFGATSFDYKVLDVKCNNANLHQNQQDSKIKITFENNTKQDIVIKPGEKYIFNV